MKAERLRQRYVRAIQRNRSIVAALLIPLSGCGADNEVDLAASTIDTDDATLAQGDLFWHIVPPQGPDDYWVRNAFRHRNCKNMKTKIDSNEPTTCSGNRFVVGIKMGYGHSSQYNVPHEIKCCEFDSVKYNSLWKSTHDRTVYETRVDNDEMTYCASGTGRYGRVASQMMSGLTGGWGHSSSYNVPHQFTCNGFLSIGDAGNWYASPAGITVETPQVDTDEFLTCESGGIIGIAGGWGHSSSQNVPHKIACATAFLFSRARHD